MRKIPVTKPYFTEEEAQMAAASGWVAQGPRVAEFEKQIAAHEGVREGVATTSCTTALHLAMVAEGLGPGMDAIAPAFTFVATENSIVAAGATPVMTDIHQETFNIDAEKTLEIIEKKYRNEGGKLINKETGNILWGIVPVHEFGLCCEIDKINEIAKTYGLTVIEDAACALGAKIGGRHGTDRRSGPGETHARTADTREHRVRRREGQRERIFAAGVSGSRIQLPDDGHQRRGRPGPDQKA